MVDAPDSKSGGVKPVRVRVSLPAPNQLRSNHNKSPPKPLIGRICLLSIWLPVSILIVFSVGDFSFGIYDDRPLELIVGLITFLFPLMWLLGIPLTVAVLLLYRRSRLLAVAVAALCAPISVTAFFLSVPLPSFLNTLLGAALAWMAVALLYLGKQIHRMFARVKSG